MVTARAASAADLPVRSAPAAYVPPPPTFTRAGFYAGLNGGLGGDHFRYPFGLTAGGAKPLVGLEADFDGAGVSGQAQLGGTVPGAGAFILSAGSQLRYLGTLRGRIGLTFDQVMVFASGGLACGRVNSTLNASGPASAPSRPAQNEAARASDRISDPVRCSDLLCCIGLIRKPLRTFRSDVLASVSLPGLTATLAEQSSFNIVRAGLNDNFDFSPVPTAVVALYREPEAPPRKNARTVAAA